MKKRSVPLSTMLDNAVGDHNPSPNIKGFCKIAHVLKKQESATSVLRLQLYNKLKSHPVRFIASLEMYYCLCLMEYLTIKISNFHVYVKDKDFVRAIEKMAQLEKLVGFFKSKPTLVQLKTMNLIQMMLTFRHMQYYEELFKKYSKKGISFPPLTYPVYDDGDSEMSSSNSSKALFVVPQLGQLDHDIFETLPKEFKTFINEMSAFREVCKEPLKKSNLLRNGSLQIHHQLQCDEAFLTKALQMQKIFKKYFDEYSDQDDVDDDIISALNEEGRKISHIVRKLEHKIERDVGHITLTEVPSSDANALMSPRAKYPYNHSDALHISEIMSRTKGNTLSRDDSQTESASTPATPLLGYNYKKHQLLPNPTSKGIPVKRVPQGDVPSSFDTSNLYTSFK
ncbi:Uncharacterized protein QTN25_004933 [Entamoeba marina]